MKSALKNRLFFLLSLVLFSCGSNKPLPKEPVISMEKAYVLLRSEGEENNLKELKNILNSDFITNNISTNIVTYPLGKTWNNNQIFSTAYNEKYDYIVLIDQVAKFTIDNRTQVGGQYQIRSYHIKSPNPDWIDLGQKTCNISIKPSIKKFTQQIVSNIAPNYKPLPISYDDDEDFAENRSNLNSRNQTYNSSKKIDDEIAELKNQLKLEKEKTETVLAEKKRLEKEYEEALANEKIKMEIALTSLKLANKEKSIDSQTKAEEELKRKKQRQKEIAESIATKREEIRIQEAEEALKTPKPIIIKEPTKEDRLKERQDAKQRIIEEKALARKKQQEETKKRQEERKRLVEEKRNEQKRLKEELIKKKEEQKRLAQAKRDQALLEEQKRLAQAKRDQALLEEQKQQEEERLVSLEKTKQLEAEKEDEKRLAKLEKEKQALAEAEKAEYNRIKNQKAKEEQKRLAQAKRDQELLEEQNQQEEERLVALEKAKRLEAEKKEEKRPAKLEKEKQALAEAEKAEYNRIENQKAKEEQKRLAQAKRDQEPREKQKKIAQINKEQELQKLKSKLEQEKLEAQNVVGKKDGRSTKQKPSRAEKLLAEEIKELEEFELQKQLKQKRRLVKAEKKARSKKVPDVVKTDSKTEKNSSKTKAPNSIKLNTLVVLRAKKDDADNLKKLQDNIEFDFLFAKAHATTKIYDNESELDKSEIVNNNQSNFDVLIIVDQLEYKGGGYHGYQISIYNYDANSNWNELDVQHFNISDRASIKKFSNVITSNL